MSSVSTGRRHFATRVLGAAGVLLFVGAFFAAPLANALMLCGMSCCHHTSAAKIEAQPAAPCGTGECTVSAPEAAMPVAPAAAASSFTSFIAIDAARVSVEVAPAAQIEVQPDVSPQHGSAPIHVLNSIFRI